MNYIAEVKVFKNKKETEETKEKIEEHLKDGTILLPVFPSVGMKIGLDNGVTIAVKSVLVLEQDRNDNTKSDCLILVE